MSDILKSYISSRFREQEKTLKIYFEDRNKKAYIKRDLYYRVEEKIDQFLKNESDIRWLTLPGLRGSGKTTSLAQIYFKYEKDFGKRILYLSLDELKSKLNTDLYQVLDIYEELLQVSYQNLEEPVLLLLDEVHYDPKWSLALKNLYDKSRSVFIVSTGSSAIELNMNADVARRTFMIHSYPLSFAEYLLVTDKLKLTRTQLAKLSQKIYKAVFESDDLAKSYKSLKKLEDDMLQIQQDLDKYELLKFLQYYSLPSVLKMKNEAEIYHSLNTVIQRIINYDLSSIKSYSQEVISKIENLLFIIASSDTLSLSELSKNLALNINTVSSILETLTKTQLLIKLPAYGSAVKASRRPAKYLFSASSLRATLISILGFNIVNQSKGKLLEDLTLSSYKRLLASNATVQLSYDTNSKGADLILQSPVLNHVVEVGWNKKSNAQIIKTMQKTNIKSGILLTNKELGYNAEYNILTLPLEWFFMV